MSVFDPNYDWILKIVEDNAYGHDYGEDGAVEFTDVHSIVDALIQEMKKRGLING